MNQNEEKTKKKMTKQQTARSKFKSVFKNRGSIAMPTTTYERSLYSMVFYGRAWAA